MWLLEVAAAVCPPVMTHGCWEKDRVSGSYCNTLPVGEGPRLISRPWHHRARLCRKLPCSPPKLSDPQTAPSPRWRHIPLLQAPLPSDCPAAAKGHLPCPEAGTLSRLASPGVTHGQRRRGVMDLPTQESQPPLCTIVSGYTGAERCLVSL